MEAHGIAAVGHTGQEVAVAVELAAAGPGGRKTEEKSLQIFWKISGHPQATSIAALVCGCDAVIGEVNYAENEDGLREHLIDGLKKAGLTVA